MKKNQAPKSKLKLSRETIRTLVDTQLEGAQGGINGTTITCTCGTCTRASQPGAGCPGTNTQFSCKIATDCCLMVP